MGTLDSELSLTGMVLKDMAVGEFDKRISLLTLERGRISAFLKGAKRPKGSPLSSIGPFCFGEFFVYEGKNSYTIRRAEISERFADVQNNLTNIAYGSYFLDVSEYYSRENADEKDRMKLLYVALKTLCKEGFNPEFVLLVFEFKNIAILGEYPNIFSCAGCGCKENLYYFSMDNRVIYCKECADRIAKTGNFFTLSSSGVYALWYIFTTAPEKVFSFKLSDKVFLELQSFLQVYKSRYFKHPFKTYEMIEILKN